MNRTITAIAAFASLGALAPAQAHASYYVGVTSQTENSFNVIANAAYFDKDFLFGYGGGITPPYGRYNPYGGGSATGTTDPTGMATFAFTNTRSDSNQGPGSSIASSSADLATATTHASGQSTNGGQGVGNAQLGDTIHFAVGGADASTVTTIGFQYVVQGTYLDLDPTNADTELKAHLSILGLFPNGLNSTINLDVQANSTNNGIPTVVSASDPFAGSGFASMTPTSFVVNGTFTILGSAPSIQLSTYLDAHQQSGAADLDYTSSFRFTSLPSDVTSTSDSGVFLAASAVPEPGSLGLVLLGGGAAALAARRERRGR